MDSWEQLADRFYTKTDLYSPLAWKDVDLANCRIAAAPFGGPIAITRNDRKLMAVNHSQPTKPFIYIYSSSGRLLSQISWDKGVGGRIVSMAWTNTDHLICVTDTGTVKTFEITGEMSLRAFSLGTDAKDHGVLDCKMWEDGLVALLGNLRFVAVSDLNEPRPKILADAGLVEAPYSWGIIPPQHTLSRHLEVLVAINSTVFLVDSTSAVDQLLHQGPFLSIAVSPNGKFLALFTSTGRLWVVSVDFQKSLAEFSTGTTVAPTQMSWCGADSVIMVWDDTGLVVGPFGDWIKYSFGGPVHIVTDIDSCRVITNDKCQLIQKVPQSTEDVFKIGSTSPGAILYDAFELFERKSARADENIRNIRSQLSEAVDICLEAAANELDQSKQKKLLKAASFGKTFLPSYNSERFVRIGQTVRVLNQLRHHEVGMPLTFTQYSRITPDVVVNRLANRRLHLLAVRICDYLKLDRDRILIHWGCTKLRTAVGEPDDLFREIVQKMGGPRSGISFVEVSKVAYQLGHTKMAADFLDYEPRAANQVPLLLSMDQEERALIKAIESGDTDLVYCVILHIKRKHASNDVIHLMTDKPLAMHLAEKYARQLDLQLLKDLFVNNDLGRANVMVLESFELQLIGKKKRLKDAADIYSKDKERRTFEAKTCEDQIRLLDIQASLEREFSQRFSDLSVSQTIHRCFILGSEKSAQKVKNDLKVPEKRYQWLNLKAIVEQRAWDRLEKFTQTPSIMKVVPLKSVVEYLVKMKEVAEAKKYAEILAKTPAGAQEARALLAQLNARR